MELFTPADAAKPRARALNLLVQAGWLSRADVGSSRIRVDTTQSSHQIQRVWTDKGVAVVKVSGPAALGERRSLQAELRAYRLAGWRPELAAVMPKAIAIDERGQTLAMECLALDAEWPPPPNPAQILDRPQLEQLAAGMAGWHQATHQLPAPPSPAFGVLGVASDPEHASQNRSAETAGLMRRIAADEGLAEILARTAKRYRHLCLIHGDLRRENLIVTRSGQLKVIDWDLSGLGDPAWDLGSLVALLVLDAARREFAMGCDHDLAVWPSDVRDGARTAFSVYAGAGGVLGAIEGETLGHVLDCATARLLHVACEWSDWSADPTHVEALVVLAQRTRAVADAIFEQPSA